MINPMHKIRGILILIFTFIFFSASAHVKIGAQLGLNMSGMIVHNPTVSNANLSYKTQLIPGFNVGILTEVGVRKNLSIQSAVLYTTKGGKYVFSNGEQEVLAPRYIEIPVNLLYKPYFNSSSTSRFILLSGFYYADRITGMGKVTAQNGTIGFDYSFSEMQKTDFGMNLGTGFESGGVEYLLQYQLGFKNSAPSNSYKIKSFTSNFSFSIALLF